MRATSLIVVLSVLVAAPASAQERLTLTWTGPEGCPDDAAVRAEVVRLLGGELPAGDPVEAHGTAEATDAGFRLTLRTRVDDAEGERVLEAAACPELADAAALIVALMIDPDAVVEEPDPVAPEVEPELPAEPVLEVREELSSPEAPAQPEARPEPAPAEPTAPEPTAPERVDGFLALGGGLDVGTTPGPSAWLWLEGGVGVPLIDGRLRVGAVLPQAGLLDGSDTRGADIYAFSVDARACVHPFEGLRGLAGCAGLMLGVSVAEGFGFLTPETGVGTYAGAMVGIEAEWRPIDELGIGLDATLAIPFNPLVFRPREAGPDERVFELEPVAGRFGLRAAAHFR